MSKKIFKLYMFIKINNNLCKQKEINEKSIIIK